MRTAIDRIYDVSVELVLEHNDLFLDAALVVMLTAPRITIRDINNVDGEGFSGDKLVPGPEDIDPALYHATFPIPIFAIQGATDLTAPPSLARAFVDAIHAPKKEFVTIPDGGHFALFTHPDAFLERLSAVRGSAR